MSGHKLTTLRVRKMAAAQITQARIMAAMRDERKQKRSAALHRQNADEMEAVFFAIESRQSRFEDTLEDFQSDVLHNLEQEACQVIHSQQESLYQDVQELFDTLWIETGQAITNGVEQNLSELDDQRCDLEKMRSTQEDLYINQAAVHEGQQLLSMRFEENQKHIADAFFAVRTRQAGIAENQLQVLQQLEFVSLQQQQVTQQQDSKERIVHQQLADTRALFDFITTSYNHEKFTPGEAKRCAYELGNARQNLELGFLDAAMFDAQHVYQRLSEQRLTLQQMQTEWELLYQGVRSKLRELLALADAVKEIPSTDLDGNEIGQNIDVDYWSSRRLSRLKTMIQSLGSKVEDQAQEFQSSDLITIQENDLPALFKELENTCNLASEEALYSQLRINIADIVIQALEDQGFVLTTSAYEKNDQRKTFQANVMNLAGDEIIIGVQPNKNKTASNHLHLISADAEQRTDHELKQRASEILHSLEEYGLQTGELQILPDTGREVKNHILYQKSQARRQDHLSV